MTTRRLVAVLAFVLCVPLLSTTVAHAQPTEPAPPAPAQEAPQQPPIPADEAPVPPREVQLLPTPEESPAPESEAESVVLELQPTIEVTDPDEAQRIADETSQALAEQGPSARAVDPLGCNNTRFDSCKTYIAPIDQYLGGQAGTGAYLGSFDVYMTLSMRSEVRNDKSTIRLTTRAVVRAGSPVSGEFNFAFAAQRWNQADPVLFGTPLATPLAPGATASRQWDDWSPKTTVSIGSTTYLFQWNAVVAGFTYVGPLPGPFYTNQKIRCDQAQAVNYSYGCVNPSYAPTVMYYENVMPNIVDNIRQGQEDFGGLGEPYEEPLSRGYSVDNRPNRDAACGASAAAKLANIGQDPPPGMENPTCDEYPFASSYQGGDGATVAWVPKSENDSQGLLMAEFYRLNRVMPDDAFYVNAYN